MKQCKNNMKSTSDYSSSDLLILVMWMIAFHSLCVGVGLIIAPSELFEFLGYSKCTERFFPTQGGVFHIIMAIGYIMGAIKYPESYDLTIFTIVVKFCATAFLIIYFIAIKQTWLILFSGVADGLMGIIVYRLYTISKRKLNDGTQK